jgi:hypothetical protein
VGTGFSKSKKALSAFNIQGGSKLRTLKAKSQKFLMLIGMIAFAALIGLSAVSCIIDTRSNDDNGGSATYSLNGVWRENTGRRVITISGSTGTLTDYDTSTLSTLGWDAWNKKYLAIGETHWRNLTKKGDRTWSGQWKVITYNRYYPNVATGTDWESGTWWLSADGQKLEVGIDGPGSTWYRQ